MGDIVWTRAAEADLQALYECLEDLKIGAGDDFLSLIDASLQLLRQFPEIAPVFDAPFRRLVLNNRRHGLFYCIEGKRIVLHAVADLRRNPDELRERFHKLTQKM
jgi:plasmid stabilization system protein ParE